jgi:capsular polysaccharide biosynthesis protein
MMGLLPPLTPLIHVVKTRAFGAPAIADVAKIVELCPSEEAWAPAATMLDSAFGKLKVFPSGISREQVLGRLTGCAVRHEPSRAFTLRNARILAGSIYAGGARRHVRSLRDAYSATKPERLQRVAFCSSSTGDRFFGHFMTEDIHQVLVAPDFGEAVRFVSRDWRHLPAYREALGVSWREIDAATAEELTVFEDVAQNSLRRRRYRELRARLRHRINPLNPGARIYLRRGSTGAVRSPSNDHEVVTALHRRGFDILDLETTPAEELIPRLLEARILVSVEGSQLAHGVYTLAENAGVCILMPPRRVFVSMKDRFDALGMPCAIVAGDDCGETYSIDIDDLDRTLDLFERRLDQASKSAMSSPKFAAVKEAPAA